MSYLEILNNILHGHPENIRRVLSNTYLLAFDRLKRAEAGNPLIHHLEVLRFSLAISEGEGLNPLVMGATALLHDIFSPGEKIRTLDVDSPKVNSKPDSLGERRRVRYRRHHMVGGAPIAAEVMQLVNELFGHSVYTEATVEAVVSIIEVHDDPSIAIPLPDEPHTRAFREADFLWRFSATGLRCDIDRTRRGSSTATLDVATLAAEQLTHVQASSRKERTLYPPEGLGFKGGTFFQTETGWGLYQKLLQERRAEYALR